jgi:hypothetical protein
VNMQQNIFIVHLGHKEFVDHVSHGHILIQITYVN